MIDSSKPRILVIIGPTAVGKTELSLAIAKRIEAEIISADSMQVYQGMDVGTAKASLDEQREVPHHLLDVVTPADSFNVADYVELASEAILDISKRGKVPLLTGGTGLYVNALLDGFLFPEQGASPQIRAALTKQANEDRAALYQELQSIDPEAAKRLHPNDTRRVIRALEIYKTTGEPISKLQQKAAQQERPYQPCMIGLTRPRQELYQRIDYRVELMLKKGLIQEVSQLLKLYPEQPTALQALGYKEIALVLKGVITLEEAVYLLKRDSRRYAKRQLSWFKRDERVHWFDVAKHSQAELLDAVFKLWSTDK